MAAMVMTYREFLNTQLPVSEFMYQNRNPDFAPAEHRFEMGDDIPDYDAVLYCGNMEGRRSDRTPDCPLLRDCFRACADHPNHRYVIVAGKSAVAITRKVTRDLPANVVRLYACNVGVVDPRVRALPLGRDFRGEEVFMSQKFPVVEPEARKLLYGNFSLSTARSRHRIYRRLRKKLWITFEHMGKWQQYPITQKEFYTAVSEHKFILSPEGIGKDCFRTWDALYLRSIPIVKESISMRHFAQLPILYTRSYRGLTPDYLDRVYEEMLDREYDFSLLTFSYWKKQIESELLKTAQP